MWCNQIESCSPIATNTITYTYSSVSSDNLPRSSIVPVNWLLSRHLGLDGWFLLPIFFDVKPNKHGHQHKEKRRKHLFRTCMHTTSPRPTIRRLCRACPAPGYHPLTRYELPLWVWGGRTDDSSQDGETISNQNHKTHDENRSLFSALLALFLRFSSPRTPLSQPAPTNNVWSCLRLPRESMRPLNLLLSICLGFGVHPVWILPTRICVYISIYIRIPKTYRDVSLVSLPKDSTLPLNRLFWICLVFWCAWRVFISTHPCSSVATRIHPDFSNAAQQF